MKKGLSKYTVYFLCFMMLFSSFAYPIQANAYTGTVEVYGVKGLSGQTFLSVNGMGFSNLGTSQVSVSISDMSNTTQIVPESVSIISDNEIGLGILNGLNAGMYKLYMSADSMQIGDPNGIQFEIIPKLDAQYFSDASGTYVKIMNSTFAGYRWIAGDAIDTFISSPDNTIDFSGFNIPDKNITVADTDLTWMLPTLRDGAMYNIEVKDSTNKVIGLAQIQLGTPTNPSAPPTTNPSPPNTNPGSYFENISFMSQNSDSILVSGMNLDGINKDNLSAQIFNIDGTTMLAQSIFVENDYNAFRFIFDKDKVPAPGNYKLRVWNATIEMTLPNNGEFQVVPELKANPMVFSGESAGQTIIINESLDAAFQWTSGDQNIEVEINGPNVMWTATLNNGLMINEDQLNVTTPTTGITYPMPAGDYMVLVKKPLETGNIILGVSRLLIGTIQVSGKVVSPEDNTTGIGGGFIRVEKADYSWGNKYPVDATGNYMINGLEPNTDYKICAIAPKESLFGDSIEQTINYNGQTINLNLQLSKIQLKGTVADPSGISLGYSNVDILKFNVEKNFDDLYKSIKTDDFGNFKISNLEPGTYKLEGFNDKSGFIKSERYEIVIDANGNYTGTSDPQLRLDYAQVKGRIYDPMWNIYKDADVKVDCKDGNSNYSASTYDGTFIVGRLGVGTYKVYAVPRGGTLSQSYPKEIRVESTGIFVDNVYYDNSTFVDLMLTNSQITGLVYEPGNTNTVATYGRVEVFNDKFEYVSEANINSDGTFNIGGLGVGIYKVKAARYDQNKNEESDISLIEILAGNIITINGQTYDSTKGFNMYLKSKAWSRIESAQEFKMNKDAQLPLEFCDFTGDVANLSVELGYTPVTIDGFTFAVYNRDGKDYIKVREFVDKSGGTITWDNYSRSTNINIGTKFVTVPENSENMFVQDGTSYATLQWFVDNFQVTYAKGDYVLVAKLSNAALQYTTEWNSKGILFTPAEGDVNTIPTISESKMLTAKVSYVDPNIGTLSEVIKQSIELDMTAPKADAHFEGMVRDEVYNKDYYVVGVNFMDLVELNDLKSNKDTYFKLTHNNTTITPAQVVLDYPNESKYCGFVRLYFDALSSGDVLTVSGVKDIVGNVMPGDKTATIKIFVKVRLTLKDTNGAFIQNAGVQIVRTDALSGSSTAAGSNDETNQTTGLMTYYGTTGMDGSCVFDVEQGTYKMYSVYTSSPEYKKIQTDFDFIANPQAGVDEISIETTVADMAPNATGSVNLNNIDTNSISTIELTFIEKKYLNAPFTSVNEYMLKDTFAKKVTVNTDGTFGIYLAPGEVGSPREYVLLGAGMNYDNNLTLPKTQVVVSVEEGQNVSINNGTPIEFVTEAINIGTIYKNETDVLENANVQIERLGLDYTVVPFKLYIDNTGKIMAKLPDGDYKMSLISREGQMMYMPDGTTNVSNTLAYLSNIQFTLTNGVISAFTGTTDMNKIVIPAVNATVNIVKKGVPFNTYTNLTFVNNDGREFQINNCNSGRYDFYLSQGTYKIKSYNTNDTGFVNVENDPKSTIVVGEGFNKTGENAIVYDAGVGNVNIVVVDDNTNKDPRANVNLNISGQKDEGGMVWKWGKTDSLGQISFTLKPGKYNITGYDDGGNWKQVNYPFEVTSENTVDLPLLVEFKISPPNTKLVFLDDTGAALSGKWVSMKRLMSETEWWDSYMGFNTDSNGEYKTNLKPGKYIIEGIQTDKEWKQLNVSFVVDETITSNNQLVKEIRLAAPVLKGILKDENGQAIAYTLINLKKTRAIGELFDKYFGFNTNSEGMFTGDLEEGEYLVEGINVWKSNGGNGYYEWREIKKQFFVVKNSSGKLEVKLTQLGLPVDILEVSIPKNNFSGYLYKTYDSQTQQGTLFTVMDNGTGWTDISLVLKQKDVDPTLYNSQPWLYQKWVNVKADGSFSMMLDPNYDYILTEAYVTGSRYEINQLITKEQLATPDFNFIIVPPKPNVSGTVKDFEDVAVTNKGWINLASADNTKWEWTEIAPDGTFGKNLEIGQTYIIKEVTILGPNGDWSTSQRYQLDKSITVGTNSENIVIKPNVKGILNLGTLFGGTAPQYVSISVRAKLQSTDANYNDWLMNPWKYEKWMAVSMNQDGSIGTFYTTLEEGTYTINGLSSSQGWQQMNEEFTINQTTAGNVTYEVDKSRYTVEFNLSSNVTGEIKDINGLAIIGANVSIERTGDLGSLEVKATEGTFNWQDRYFNANTDNDGKFGLKLKDGNYRLNGYSTQWTQDNNGGWIPGQWINVNFTFKVQNGTLMNMNDTDVSTLQKIIIKPNLKVAVTKIYKAGDWTDGYATGSTLNEGEYSKLKYAWLNIKPYKPDGQGGYILDDNDWTNNVWANTGDNGYGVLTLNPGKYRVMDAGGYNFYTRVDKDFEIDSNGNIIDDDLATNFIDLATKTLTISQQQPNFKGKVYLDTAKTSAMNSGWISVAPGKTGEIDWTQTRWFNVKSDGSFEEFLGDNPNGWRIVNISGYKQDGSYAWMKSNITLTAANGTVTADNAIYNDVTTGSIIVIPPTENLVGTVSFKSRDGDVKQVVGNAWITIKPAGTASNDWTGAFGAEYKNINGTYKFSTVADPGDYKVVAVGGYDSDRNEYFWYDTDVSFTIDAQGNMKQNAEVITSLSVAPPLPNVTGTVSVNSPNGNQSIGNGSISFARYKADGTQVRMDGTDISAEEMVYKYAGDDVHWWFTRWAEIDTNGNFAINLPLNSDGGYYKVINAYGMNGWYRSEIKFRVNGVNQLEIIDDNNNVSSTNVLTVAQPGPNLTLTITDAPASDNMAWIEIESVETGKKFIQAFESEYKAEASNSYTFKIKLKNGTYKIKNIGTSTSWYVVDGNEFQVTSETSQVSESLTFLADRITLGGQILNAPGSLWIGLQEYDASDVKIGEKKWIQTDEQGLFTFKANANTKWAVEMVRTSSGNMSITTPTIETATVTNTNMWSIDFSNL